MEFMRIAYEEQQSISLVLLGLLTLAGAAVFSARVQQGRVQPRGLAFWALQAILFGCGLAMIICPGGAFAAALAAVAGCTLLLSTGSKSLPSQREI